MNNITLKTIQLEHWETFKAIVNEPDVQKDYFLGQNKRNLTDQQARNFLHMFNNLENYGIYQGNQLVGLCNANYHGAYREIGYAIHPYHRGKGIAYQTIKALQNKYHQDQLYATPNLTNLTSCHLLDKAGFQYEGIHTTHNDRDHHRYTYGN